MSDPNDKSASILLKKQGKTEAVFLYDFAQFTGQNEDAGLYRAKINGCWHCPDGKYTALSADAVAALVRDWLTGAPHIRQRLYWVADADGEQLYRGRFRKAGGRAEFADGGGVIGLADTAFCGIGAFHGQSYKSLQPEGTDRGHCFSCGLGNTVGKGLEGYAGHGDGEAGRQKQDRSTSTAGSNGVPLPTDGFWRNADWLLCRDGKWRPVEPGTFPLAHGTTARVGRLRGYGNAIVAPQAAAFIAVFLLSLHK